MGATCSSDSVVETKAPTVPVRQAHTLQVRPSRRRRGSFGVSALALVDAKRSAGLETSTSSSTTTKTINTSTTTATTTTATTTPVSAAKSSSSRDASPLSPTNNPNITKSRRVPSFAAKADKGLTRSWTGISHASSVSAGGSSSGFSAGSVASRGRNGSFRSVSGMSVASEESHLESEKDSDVDIHVTTAKALPSLSSAGIAVSAFPRRAKVTLLRAPTQDTVAPAPPAVDENPSATANYDSDGSVDDDDDDDEDDDDRSSVRASASSPRSPPTLGLLSMLATPPPPSSQSKPLRRVTPITPATNDDTVVKLWEAMASPTPTSSHHPLKTLTEHSPSRTSTSSASPDLVQSLFDAHDRSLAPTTPPSPPPKTPSAAPPTVCPPRSSIRPDAGVDLSPADRLATGPFPASVSSTSPSAVTSYLTSPFAADILKVRAVFRFITHAIRFDVSADDSTDQSATAVLARGTGTGAGFANLFHAMAKLMGVHSTVVQGVVLTSNMTRDASGDFHTASHSWNAVVLSESWYLLDCCWASGQVNHATQTFTRSFSNHYWLPKPRVFVSDHLAQEQRWQLLAAPIVLADFLQQVLLTPTFYSSDMRLVTHPYQRHILTPDGQVSLRFSVPAHLCVSATLTRLDKASREGGEGGSSANDSGSGSGTDRDGLRVGPLEILRDCDMAVPCQDSATVRCGRFVDNAGQMVVNVACPSAGEYALVVFVGYRDAPRFNAVQYLVEARTGAPTATSQAFLCSGVAMQVSSALKAVLKAEGTPSACRLSESSVLMPTLYSKAHLEMATVPAWMALRAELWGIGSSEAVKHAAFIDRIDGDAHINLQVPDHAVASSSRPQAYELRLSFRDDRHSETGDPFQEVTRYTVLKPPAATDGDGRSVSRMSSIGTGTDLATEDSREWSLATAMAQSRPRGTLTLEPLVARPPLPEVVHLTHRFPKQYTAFRGQLHAPRDYQLTPGVHHFHLEVAGMAAVQVVCGSNTWSALHPSSPTLSSPGSRRVVAAGPPREDLTADSDAQVWSGNVAVLAGMSVDIVGRKQGSSKWVALLQYESLA